MLRLSALIYLYGRRLRTSPAQELLAGAGIALGVALMFAVQVANGSITGSAAAISRSITGPATLQVRSRGEDGFDEALLGRVRRLPGVEQAAEVLDLPATIRGPRSGDLTVQLASADPGLAALDGLSTKVSLNAAVAPGVMLPSATARALEISTTVGDAIEGPPSKVTLNLRGRATSVKVTAILGPETIGALSGAMAAFAPLSMIQRLAALPGRVTRILVQSAPGREALVRRELERVAAGRLTVTPAGEDVALLAQALRPNAQATGFFALVSGLVGLLLAFNAMLLTAPERRRMIADLRIQGVRRVQLAQMLLFQALCLGVFASLAGLFAGYLLSRGVFHETPNYLAVAFPLGSQTVIGVRPLLISFAGGVLATCLAAAPPLLDLRRSRAVDAVYLEDGEPGQALGRRARLWLLAAGAALILATSGLLLLTPSAAIVAIVGLAFGALLMIPFGFTVLLEFAEMFGRTHGPPQHAARRVPARCARPPCGPSRSRRPGRSRSSAASPLRARTTICSVACTTTTPTTSAARTVGATTATTTSHHRLPRARPAGAHSHPAGRRRRARLPGRLPGHRRPARVDHRTDTRRQKRDPAVRSSTGTPPRRRRGCGTAGGSPSQRSSPPPATSSREDR